MEFPVLAVLVICAACATAKDADQGSPRKIDGNFAKATLQKVLERERRYHPRRARVVAPFSDALSEVLSTTIGFTRMEVSGRNTMLFVKVGSYADATSDFHSLGPNSVSNLSPKVTIGVREGHAIGLRSQPPTLYVLNGKKSEELLEWGPAMEEEKVIRYFNSDQEAKFALSRWGVFASAQ